MTYRQNTELMIEAWHWNPRGTWSNAAKQEGYFTGSAEPTDEKILHSWAYPLPHRGVSRGRRQRLVALDRWRPEILLEEQSVPDQGLHGRRRFAAPAVGDDRSGRQDGCQCDRIAWADPYAKRYYVQFWTGEQEPFYDGTTKGTWQTFPMGTITDGKGGTVTLKLVSLEDSGALPAHLDDGVVQHLRHTRRGRQAQLRGIRHQRTLCRERSRPTAQFTDYRQAPPQPQADHHLAIVGRSRGTPLPISTNRAATRSDSISSSTAA